MPDEADVYVKAGDLWVLGDHRLLCGDATNPEDVARLLDGAEPTLLATDPPYGVSLGPTWRDAAGCDTLGPATKPYMVRRKLEGDGSGARRRKGHRNTTVSGDTRADWSDAFALVPSLTVGYVWHASAHAAEVADGLARIGFEHVSQVIWDKGLFAMGRSWYHWAHEPCWVVRSAGAKVPFLGERDQSTVWRAPSPKMIMSNSDEEKLDHPTQKPVLLFETPIRNHLRPGGAGVRPVRGLGNRDRRCGGARPALLCDGDRSPLRAAVHRALAEVQRSHGGPARWFGLRCGHDGGHDRRRRVGAARRVP